ncbi:MAG: hypothetical protein M3P94_03340 [Chloroflexota bacterium]|nr:hypothetical protein [Chloroflexota bacterium]
MIHEQGPVSLSFEDYQVLFNLVERVSVYNQTHPFIEDLLLVKALVVMVDLADQGSKLYEQKMEANA